jgi:hypothetical protein
MKKILHNYKILANSFASKCQHGLGLIQIVLPELQEKYPFTFQFCIHVHFVCTTCSKILGDVVMILAGEICVFAPEKPAEK